MPNNNVKILVILLDVYPKTRYDMTGKEVLV